MEIKDPRQALKLQKELSERLQRNVEKLLERKAPSIAATMEEQEGLLALARAELAMSEKEKEQAIARWEQRIRQRKATVERLQKGLETLKKKTKPKRPSKKIVSRKKVVRKKRG